MSGRRVKPTDENMERVEKIEITTKSGFTCRIKASATHSWKMLKLVKQISSNDAIAKSVALADMIEFLLGTDGEMQLLEHLANINDCNIDDVSMEQVGDEIGEILINANSVKKS